MKSSYLIKQIGGSILFFSCIFIGAGKLGYWQGLLYVAIGLIMIVLNFTILQIDSQLQEERSRSGEGTKQWDKIILLMSFLVTITMFVIAGLDSGRFHWSAQFHPVLYFLGVLLTVAGQVLFLIAQKQNRFFSSTVRIQTNRKHMVCDKGLYSFVRHPAYLGSMVQAMGFPLVFGSLWSIIPVGVMIFLLIKRTNLEDEFLKNELKGYAEYAAKVRYRIFPLLW